MEQATNARKTAAIFVDDGGDDAYEFATNYIWFDPTDALDRRRAWKEAETLWALRVSRLPAAARYCIGAPRVQADDATSCREEARRESA
jgi:hypothetical protein